MALVTFLIFATGLKTRVKTDRISMKIQPVPMTTLTLTLLSTYKGLDYFTPYIDLS